MWRHACGRDYPNSCAHGTAPGLPASALVCVSAVLLSSSVFCVPRRGDACGCRSGCRSKHPCRTSKWKPQEYMTVQWAAQETFPRFSICCGRTRISLVATTRTPRGRIGHSLHNGGPQHAPMGRQCQRGDRPFPGMGGMYNVLLSVAGSLERYVATGDCEILTFARVYTYVGDPCCASTFSRTAKFYQVPRTAVPAANSEQPVFSAHIHSYLRMIHLENRPLMNRCQIVQMFNYKARHSFTGALRSTSVAARRLLLDASRVQHTTLAACPTRSRICYSRTRHLFPCCFDDAKIAYV